MAIYMGMAIMLAPGGQISDQIIFGTPGYHAPEMVSEQEYSLSSDIYSLGITFVVLVSIYIYIYIYIYSYLMYYHL